MGQEICDNFSARPNLELITPLPHFGSVMKNNIRSWYTRVYVGIRAGRCMYTNVYVRLPFYREGLVNGVGWGEVTLAIWDQQHNRRTHSDAKPDKGPDDQSPEAR